MWKYSRKLNKTAWLLLTVRKLRSWKYKLLKIKLFIFVHKIPNNLEFFFLPAKRSSISLWRVHENLLFYDWGHQMSTWFIFLKLWSELKRAVEKIREMERLINKMQMMVLWPPSELSSIYDRKSCWPSIILSFLLPTGKFCVVYNVRLGNTSIESENTYNKEA